MRSWKSRAFVLATAVLCSVTPAVAAHAVAPDTNSHPAVAGTNTLLDADVVFQVHKKVGLVLAAEGHLSLKKYSGTTYHGTFVDDLGAGRSYTATATKVSTATDAGVFTIATAAGSFHVTSTATSQTVTAPSKFGAGVTVELDYHAHKYTKQFPISVTIDSRLGVYHAPAVGALTLTTDSLGYIAPHSSAAHIAGSFVYRLGTATKQYTSYVTSSGRYTAPDCSNGGSLRFALPQGSSPWHLNAVEADTSSASSCPLVATIARGDGASYSEATFIGKLGNN